MSCWGSCSQQEQACTRSGSQPPTHLQAEDVQAVVLEEAQPAAILEDGVAHGRQLHGGMGLQAGEGGCCKRAAALAAANCVVAAAPAAIHPCTVSRTCMFALDQAPHQRIDVPNEQLHRSASGKAIPCPSPMAPRGPRRRTQCELQGLSTCKCPERLSALPNWPVFFRTQTSCSHLFLAFCRLCHCSHWVP